MYSNKTLISYLLLLSPILLGMGSGYFVSRKKIPKVKSKWNPPDWLFIIVWPILYLLLGYSSYLIWNSNDKKKNFYLIIYLIHLILLLLWWPFFVYFPNKLFSFITLVMLAIYAIIITYLFSTINKTSAYCLIPYILWLSFASFLTYNT
jgi:tryptophan-rich sensory protein